MKKIFKLLAVVLAVSLVLLGCGQKQSTETKQEEQKLDFGGRTMNVVLLLKNTKNYLINLLKKQTVK